MKTRCFRPATLVIASMLTCLVPLSAHALDGAPASMVSGTGGKPLRLKITPPVEKSGSTWQLVMVHGLPEVFELSKGTKLGNGTWSLTPEEVNNVLVLTPRAYEGAVDLEIVFVANDNTTRERTGIKLLVWAAEGEQPAAPAAPTPPAPAQQAEVTATPASAPAAPAIAATETTGAAATEKSAVIDDTEDRILFSRELIKHKRLAAARMMLEPLAVANNATAAQALGETYDPKVFNALKIKDEKPNAAKARAWYTKAKELGDPNAQASLNALAQLQRKNTARNAAPVLGATPAPAPRSVN